MRLLPFQKIFNVLRVECDGITVHANMFIARRIGQYLGSASIASVVLRNCVESYSEIPLSHWHQEMHHSLKEDWLGLLIYPKHSKKDAESNLRKTGPLGGASNSTSFAQANRWKMPSSSRLTGAYAMSV